jgi:signal peptidase I
MKSNEVYRGGEVIRKSKLTDLIIDAALVFGIIVAVSKIVGVNNLDNHFGIWYVYSGSMIPVININDGFFLEHKDTYNVDDIITFKPKVLQASYVTHRIISKTANGDFITKGDNNILTDQSGGEPAVSNEQIIGRVFMFNNTPLIIPKIGLLSTRIKSFIRGLNAFLILSIGIIIVLICYVIDNLSIGGTYHKRKKFKLNKVAPYFDYIFWIFMIWTVGSVLLTSLMIRSWDNNGFSYVVVDTKGISSPAVGETYTKDEVFQNKMLIPLIMIIDAENKDVIVNPNTLYFKPNEKKGYSITLKVPNKSGLYSENISIRVYPNVFPKAIFNFLYRVNIFLPIGIIVAIQLSTSVMLYIWWLKRWRDGNYDIIPYLIKLKPFFKKIL